MTLHTTSSDKAVFSVPGKGRIATVFGGSGFIGSQIVRELAAQGWVVRVAVRRPSRALELKTSGDVGQVLPMVATTTDRNSVRAAVSGACLVVNATGILFETKTQTFDGIHNKGPAFIAEACKDFGVDRLVHISALGADIQSNSDYARSKAAGEEAVFNRFKSATILRPSVVFGPEDQLFNRFGLMARTAPMLPLIGGGETKLQPVYVGDVADAALSALANPSTRGQTYELGGPEVVTFKELLTYLLKLVRRNRRLQSISFGFAKFIAKFAQLLPNPVLTVDQVKLLKADNVVDSQAKGLGDLGIKPTSMDAIVPSYVEQYRAGGRFTVRKQIK
ncbi:MAG: complex I NDUFA9 subunit family protein [Alphaproteobacteria bacterium]